MNHVVKCKLPWLGVVIAMAVIGWAILSGSAATAAPMATPATSKTATTPVESPQVSIVIDDTKVDTTGKAPLTYNGRVLLQLRLAFEQLGATVNWDNTAKTATASKGDITVKIKLNDKTAYVNDQAVTLDTAALVYKDHFYMPFRFLGEAFGGTVNWDNTTKTVTITSPLPLPEPEPIPDPVYQINGYEISTTMPVQTQNGRVYIYIDDFMSHLANYLPAEYFFSWSNNGDGHYTFLFDGTQRELIADADYYLLNGKATSLTDKVITINGNVYIPLSFSREVLSGTISYDEATNTTAVSINRPKFKSEFTGKENINNLIPTLVEGSHMSNDQLLSISDNPEELSTDCMSANENAILMQTNITGKSSVTKHRVFGWHTNKLGKQIKIGIVVENTGSNTINIDSARVASRTTFNTWVNYDVGLPLAEAMLSNQMSNVTPIDASIAPGDAKIIQSFTLNEMQMVGFIVDLELARTSNQNISYQLRVVMGIDEDEDLSTISGDDLIVELYKTHPRGTWESSEILAEIPNYNVGEPEVSYSLSNGLTDHVFDQASSLDPADQTIGNIGHFGVVYRVRVPIYNNQGSDPTVRFRLVGRGGLYSCAVKTPNGVYITPNLQPQTEAAIIYDYSPAPGISYIDIEIVHAGGSNLPVAVNVLTL